MDCLLICLKKQKISLKSIYKECHLVIYGQGTQQKTFVVCHLRHKLRWARNQQSQTSVDMW